MRELFPPVSIERVELVEANRLLVEWCHPLGACHRPFRSECAAMLVEGRAVAVTVSASIVSATVDGRDRNEVVELARIGRSPAQRWVLRPMLRIWREVFAPRWACWPVTAAVSYALPGYSGNLYRFDGWRRVGEVPRSGGGGTWSGRPKVNELDGRKVLWAYELAARDQSAK